MSTNARAVALKALHDLVVVEDDPTYAETVTAILDALCPPGEMRVIDRRPRPCPECDGSGEGPVARVLVTTCQHRAQFERSKEMILGWTCPVHLHSCPGGYAEDDGPCPKCHGAGTVDTPTLRQLEHWGDVDPDDDEALFKVPIWRIVDLGDTEGQAS